MTAAKLDTENWSREEGTLVDMEFRASTSPWGIARFRRENGTTFSATGDFGQTVLFEEFILYGQRVPDVEGGDFEVNQFTSRPPRSLKAISGYLSALTGASRSSTVKLVEHYGENTIDVLERSPDLIGDAGIPAQDIERLVTGWKSLRSDRLALSKIEVKGIPMYKLSKLQRYYGNDTDLNQVIKTDPYALYVFFEDLPFPKAMALANQLGVSNQSESAIRGAVIAALRREAWLGHSVIEGKQLGQLVVKLLRVHPELVRPLLPPAVAELRRLNLIHVEDRRVQLKQLHDAEHKLFSHIARWSQLNESDLELDLVPSEDMGLKMLKPMKLKQASAKELLAGITSLLSECFAIVQCQTYEDQLFVAKALALIFTAYDANAVITTYTTEMLREVRAVVGDSVPTMTYAELVGLDRETGIPLQRSTNPVEADAIVIIGADALGVEEMNYLIEAAPLNGRFYLLGCPKDLPSLSLGQPFADLIDSRQFKAFHSSFWGVPDSAKRLAQELIWAADVRPDLHQFDPTQPLSWFECEADDLSTFIPDLLTQISTALDIDPLADIRVVAPATTHSTVKKVQEGIIAAFAGSGQITFQGRPYNKGIPVVIRQPLETADCPAFSVFWPTEISTSELRLRDVQSKVAIVGGEDRIDAFDAVVMTPKFIRGRRYELVVLLAIADQRESINLELLSSLLNTTVRSLIVVGEIVKLADGISDRASSRTRSKLLDWISEK
jgi:hypothetical protein